MHGVIVAWYAWLSHLAQGPIVVIQGWDERFNLPLMSAVLFGLIGATSPCQLTTSLTALAFSARQSGRGGPLGAAAAYVAGKLLVYSLVGGLVIGLGLQLQAASIPVIVVVRKVLGPLMVVVGLGLLGLIRLRGGIGYPRNTRLPARLVDAGLFGAFGLGVIFAFAFCPTLFWLFFGLTLPLALRTAGGWSFPSAFALGTGLPLLAMAAVVSLGVGAAERIAGGMVRLSRSLTPVAGAVFVLAGLHDTLVSWLL